VDEILHATDETLELAPVLRKLAVVGAGIAGLQAAVTAAARGHQVKVWGHSSDVGGRARLLAQLPLGESISSIYDHQWISAQRLGVQFQLGQTATAADVLAWQPDAVVLATGADMTWPMDLPEALRVEGLLPDLHEIRHRNALTDRMLREQSGKQQTVVAHRNEILRIGLSAGHQLTRKARGAHPGAIRGTAQTAEEQSDDILFQRLRQKCLRALLGLR
jgi:NADPH-dependent glutamate synthase beta subunit-like oxidoreductase